MRLAVALLALAAANVAQAETRLYVIAVGNNAVPADGASEGNQALQPLRYADDDAAAIAELGLELGAHATLLTVLDGASQRRFPEVAALARPPTLAELRRTVAWHHARFEADKRAGDDPVLLLFFSGHGTRGGTGPALALIDGPLSADILHAEVLPALSARYVHLLVDACHAEAVVRPRDLDAESVPVDPNLAQKVLARTSLARFPHVGAIIASTSGSQAHEWDVFERGVFTHQLISAARGAADVNGDARIEYSEVHAFFAAANRELRDPRARPAIVVHAPAVNGRAPLVDLSRARHAARLHGDGRVSRALHVEDERGARVADLHPEPGFRFSLVIPTGRTLFVRGESDEAQIRPVPGAQIRLDALVREPRRQRARGAIESAFHRGLFATPFGPTYYRGFVDAEGTLLPVTFPAPGLAETAPAPRRDLVRVAAFAGAGALAATSLGFSLLSWQARRDLDAARYERPASEARDRVVRHRAFAIASGVGAAALLGWGLLRGLGAEPEHALLVPSLDASHAGLTLQRRF